MMQATEARGRGSVCCVTPTRFSGRIGVCDEELERDAQPIPGATSRHRRLDTITQTNTAGGGTEAPTFLGGTDSDTPSFSNSIGLCISTFFPFLDSSI